MSSTASGREGPSGSATVTVRGEGSIRTVPDEAVLWITLSAFEQSPGQALGDVAEGSEGLVALLDELGVAEVDRSTAGVSVEEEFDPPSRGGRGVGHRARARVSVRLRDPDLIGRAISRASEDLRASIDGPHWYITPSNPVRFQAATRAAADARQKAQAYADGVDVTLGPLMRLVEPATLPGPAWVPRRASAASGGHDMPIEIEEHEVRAFIDATFELQISRRRPRTRQQPG